MDVFIIYRYSQADMLAYPLLHQIQLKILFQLHRHVELQLKHLIAGLIKNNYITKVFQSRHKNNK